MSADEEGRWSFRKKVSRVGLMLLILGLAWYLYLAVRQGRSRSKPAPVPWHTPHRAHLAAPSEREFARPLRGDPFTS